MMEKHTDCSNYVGDKSFKCAVYDFYFCLGKICKYYNKSLDSQEVKDFMEAKEMIFGGK